MTDNSICYWRCPNCGQVHFGDTPPDLCDYCRDFTTWELLAGEAPPEPPSTIEKPEETEKPPEDGGKFAKQKRLFD
jgi:hypothetical protein